MARQSLAPVQFNLSTRPDRDVKMTSGRAGKVIPMTYIPLLRGDSASGRVGIDIDLAPMPRPLLNAVHVHAQAWFIPKPALPQFSGLDEFMHSYLGEPIKQLGSADRTPPPFFTVLDGTATATAAASAFFKTLGLHIPTGATINADLIDSFVTLYNFRLAAHSNKLARKQYASENLANALALPRAFWPTGRLSRVVPDYERALVIGSLDLDVAAGIVPIRSWNYQTSSTNVFPLGQSAATARVTDSGSELWDSVKGIWGDMEGMGLTTSLADIDKARTTQAFAKLRQAYAGSNTNGFVNDDAIIATLMQGFQVPETEFRRPWLLDSQRVPVGFLERPATDGANLDKSTTEGRASVSLSINVPRNDFGGMIIVTVEVMPERLDERMSDEFLLCTSPDDLPNALRDVQRVEPVDMVPNRRVDAKHSTPSGAYGWEPMNDKWNREFTRLGGAFYQATPGAAWTEQRSGIWTVDLVNPVLNSDHWLCPDDFPHDVFADTLADAFEAVVRHNVAIVGLTQIGDPLAENNDDFEAVQAEA